MHDEIAHALDDLRDASRAFFSDLAFAHRTTDRIRGEERVRATPGSLAQAGDSAAQLTGTLDRVEAALGRVPRRTADDETPRAGGTAGDSPWDDGPDRDEAVSTLARRAHELRDEIRLLLRSSDSDYVYFVEFRGRGVFLRAAPVDVSQIIRELLLDRMRTTILTSATLTVDGSFGYIRKRLGIVGAEEICLPSEFDFSAQALMYLPARMPDPRSSDFSAAAGREVVEILKRTRGRAFVLFTSYATMRDVLGIAEMALDYPILAQGAAPRTQLLKQFRETPHSVLFATSSFWRGRRCGRRGAELRDHRQAPVHLARRSGHGGSDRRHPRAGRRPVRQYQVPLAIWRSSGAWGATIRHRLDCGVLAVLDPAAPYEGLRTTVHCLAAPAPTGGIWRRLRPFAPKLTA